MSLLLEKISDKLKYYKIRRKQCWRTSPGLTEMLMFCQKEKSLAASFQKNPFKKRKSSNHPF
jgi:hypothetical protein